MQGNDVANGMHVQLLAPKGVWQGSRLLPRGKFALLGCTISPSFDDADYESGKREELLRKYP
jgi:predicted cupin superfamily sugar epimerase